MSRDRYKQFKVVISLFVGTIIGLSIWRGSNVLALVALFIGALFLTLVRKQTKVLVDEREKTVQEKAAQKAYGIFVPTLAITTLILLIPSQSGLSVFSRGEFAYLESIGTIFAYLTLFFITIYTIAYYVINRKYGGGDK